MSQTTKDENQVSVKIDRVIKEKIEQWIKTDRAKEQGFYFVSQFITQAARDAVYKYAKEIDEKPIRFFYPNSKDDLLSLDFDVYSTHVYCRTCKTENCVHIKMAYKDTQINRYLKKANIKLPSQKTAKKTPKKQKSTN